MCMHSIQCAPWITLPPESLSHASSTSMCMPSICTLLNSCCLLKCSAFWALLPLLIAFRKSGQGSVFPRCRILINGAYRARAIDTFMCCRCLTMCLRSLSAC